MRTTRQARTLRISATLILLILPFQNCAPGFSTLGSSDSSGVFSTEALSQKSAFGQAGLRRLTRFELLRSLSDVLNVNGTSVANKLPSDEAQTIPFSNEYGTQAIASTTIENYQDFAESYSNLVVSQSNFLSKNFSALAGCQPISTTDRDCFLKFVTKTGRRILRRPVTLAEANFYADNFLPLASSEGSFATAVELTIQAWIQNLEFLYRIEAGTGFKPEPNLLALNDFEIAARLSYLIWGSTPDDTLLDEAQAGRLKDASNRVLQAMRMLQDPKAKTQWAKFHAEWMGYDEAILPASLSTDMRAESDRLISRIVFEKNQDWLTLFSADETYLTPALATHYGMGPVNTAGWVRYNGQRGGGILAHATFLSKGAKFGDTSPTLRGYEIYKRLMCGKLGQIPENIDTDNPPGTATDCKIKRYSMRTMTSCAGCHQITDNIGFGLENFGVTGEWRTTEPGLPNCEIQNDGSVAGQAYTGPAALGVRLSNNPQVAQCAVTQLFRFFTGRLDDTKDSETLAALNSEYLGKRSLQSILIAVVQSPAFQHRVQ